MRQHQKMKGQNLVSLLWVYMQGEKFLKESKGKNVTRKGKHLWGPIEELARAGG